MWSHRQWPSIKTASQWQSINNIIDTGWMFKAIALETYNFHSLEAVSCYCDTQLQEWTNGRLHAVRISFHGCSRHEQTDWLPLDVSLQSLIFVMIQTSSFLAASSVLCFNNIFCLRFLKCISLRMEALFSTASSADWNMYNENTSFGKRWYF